MKDLKYIFAYALPTMAYLAISLGGLWSYAVFLFGFGLIPVTQIFFKKGSSTPNLEEPKSKLKIQFFDYLLYLNIPILYGLLGLYFYTLATQDLAIYEVVGMTGCVGVIVGTIGINVAHELGHRSTWYEQLMAKVLLLSALYMHFFIEHNRGHHKNVATDLDPASSKLNETVYAFWLRSIWGGYLSAWRLEHQRLRRVGKSFWSISNTMLWFQVIQVVYLGLIGLVFGWIIAGMAVVVALFGIILLESANYIEHYGLRRKKLPSGRYEKVSIMHSWNSNHELGRIFLYELTFHSDHHHKAARKYQSLRHFEAAPQLPTGYLTAIMMSLVPPLWFAVMNGRVEKIEKQLWASEALIHQR